MRGGGGAPVALPSALSPHRIALPSAPQRPRTPVASGGASVAPAQICPSAPVDGALHVSAYSHLYERGAAAGLFPLRRRLLSRRLAPPEPAPSLSSPVARPATGRPHALSTSNLALRRARYARVAGVLVHLRWRLSGCRPAPQPSALPRRTHAHRRQQGLLEHQWQGPHHATTWRRRGQAGSGRSRGRACALARIAARSAQTTRRQPTRVLPPKAAPQRPFGASCGKVVRLAI